MILNVSIVEAKKLANVSGTIRCKVFLVDGKKESRPEVSRTAVEQSSNPVFSDATFNL